MLKFGLVGCGRIARRHAELLAQNKVRGASLAAVCDVDPTRASLLGQQFNIPHFTDMHDMMRSVDFDAVSVLTPSGIHAQNVVELAPYGKHIIVEKPMALRLGDADRMILACAQSAVKLFVVKQNRFNVPVVKLREALVAGRFGKLFLGTVRVRWSRDQAYYDQDAWRGTWALDGGVLANQASHHIDLLEWMMGDIESVFAMGTTALAKIETEDTAIATLKFKSGALGLVEATTAVRPKDLEGSLSILGEKGTVEIGGFAVNELKTWNFVERRPEDDIMTLKYSVNPPNVYGFGHQAYYEHVVECISGNGAALVDGREGRRSLELISAIYESIETSKQVWLPVLPDRSRLGR